MSLRAAGTKKGGVEPKRREKEDREAVSKEVLQELQQVVESLGGNSQALDVPGQLSLIRSKVASLQALAKAPPPVAGVGGVTDADALRTRLAAAQELIREAESKVIEAEARAEGCEVELFYPINAELTKTRSDLRAAEAALAKAEATKEELKAALAAAEARIELLVGGYKDLGTALGVGGFAGNILMQVMGDEALIKDCKQKVGELKRLKR